MFWLFVLLLRLPKLFDSVGWIIEDKLEGN